MKKYWDEVLFPEMLIVIRGERYLAMSDKQMNDQDIKKKLIEMIQNIN